MFKWFFNLFRKKKSVVKSDKKSTPLYYQIAQQELNTKEIPGSGNNSRIIEYHKATSLSASQDSVPWCASFLNWTMLKAKIKGTNSARARSFLNWGTEVTDPKEGDVVIFWRGSPDSSSGHVALFVKKIDSNFISVLGGNQSDAVCIKNYPTDRIIGYRRLV